MADAKSISQGELQAHVDEKDCWLAIHGKVYNVSGYLVDHPGGLDVMMEYAGVLALIHVMSAEMNVQRAELFSIVEVARCNVRIYFGGMQRWFGVSFTSHGP